MFSSTMHLAQSCDGLPPCGGIGQYVAFHNTVELCCAAHLYWISFPNWYGIHFGHFVYSIALISFFHGEMQPHHSEQSTSFEAPN
jgi:hypothetical protein